MSTPIRTDRPNSTSSRPASQAPNRSSQAAQARKMETPQKAEETQKPAPPPRPKSVWPELPQADSNGKAPAQVDTLRHNFGGEVEKAPRNTNVNFGGHFDLPQSPQLEAKQPAELKTGTLDYYQQRAQDYEQRHPGQEPPDYYLNYGDKYVHKFDELKPELSDQGDQFVDATRQNLQEAMEKKRREDPEGFARLEEDPEALRKFAFDTHSQAYLDGGIADLPPEDLLKIVTTPDFKDSLSVDGLREIGETVGPVLAKHPELAATVPAELLSQLYDKYPKLDLPGGLPSIPAPPVLIPIIPFL